ncbi:Uncharacterized protein PBTT_04303 [Plasmodiophora brassicae]
MGIGSDGILLFLADVDNRLKTWCLDFGDCHKSLLAHDDVIVAVNFIRCYLLTTSKDKQVEQIYARLGTT